VVPDKRLGAITNLHNKYENFYLLCPTNYAEYDFKNWQTLELLEDAFWESTYSSYSHEEYLNNLQTMEAYQYFQKQEDLFNLLNRSRKFKSNLFTKPFVLDTQKNQNIFSVPIYAEDVLMAPSLTELKNFGTYNNEILVESNDDSYDSLKYCNYLHFLNSKNILNYDINTISPVSYTHVIDNFRADYEDPQWFLDVDKDKAKNNFGLTLKPLAQNEVRVTNPIKLRSTTKNAMVTYSAIQKVFRSRYDEGRSNARLQDLSNSYESHPFLTSSKVPYESLLGKNTENFFTSSNFSRAFFTNFNETSFI
jgi:hypothetical protein